MKLGGEIVKKNSLGLTRMNELGWRYILVPLPNKRTQLLSKLRKNQTNKQGGKNETDKTKQRKKRTTKK